MQEILIDCSISITGNGSKNKIKINFEKSAVDQENHEKERLECYHTWYIG